MTLHGKDNAGYTESQPFTPFCHDYVQNNFASLTGRSPKCQPAVPCPSFRQYYLASSEANCFGGPPNVQNTDPSEALSPVGSLKSERQASVAKPLDPVWIG